MQKWTDDLILIDALCRIGRAWENLVVEAMELKTAEFEEQAKSYKEQQWQLGYAAALQDIRKCDERE